jgi:hypothetical protein
MKKIAVAAALAVALLAAACTAEDIEEKVAQAQALVAKGCGVVPLASAVAEVMASGNVAVSTAAGFAKAFCDGYKAKSSSAQTLFGFGDTAKEVCDGVVVAGVCVPAAPVDGK